MVCKKIAPCSEQADTARDVSFADATNARNISRGKYRNQPNGTRYRITASCAEPFIITLCGRTPQSLEQLRRASVKGFTPIENPAPCGRAYISKLRKIGVEIEIICEPHRGASPRHDARYVLRYNVTAEVVGVRQ
ncbi:winged helix domain-containing protein [Oceaniglobus ichthyenteri]|uniref:winged helix domain-containing protein n=1 Tax=Oceaniglobus ichthyenteri TaxID=2136177 RepID=UPI000F84BF6A|nr:hypothetical protein [Oceaniglobus ichthyenteri]